MNSRDPLYQPGKTQVPGQLLGYGLQYTRMLMLLLESDQNTVVSLEVFEDVGAQGPSGTVASQTKSSTGGNPVSNKAVPFWKTLGNWIDAIEKRQLPLEGTVFELYVFGDFEGEIVQLFSKAMTESDAKNAVQKAKTLLFDTPIPEHVARVLGATESVLLPLLSRFRYRHGSRVSEQDVKELFDKLLIPATLLDSVMKHAVGWVKTEVDRLLERAEPAFISVSRFRTEMTSYVASLSLSAVLKDLAGPALQTDIEQNRARRYVWQLKLISAQDGRILGAISAYLRASSNRVEWGRRGMVHSQSLEDYAERLTNYWENSRIQCELLLDNKEAIKQGQYLLAECMKFSQPLQGMSVPHDFAEGCFHALADELVIGWHPNYKELTKDLS
jgi:hypothetical protein